MAVDVLGRFKPSLTQRQIMVLSRWGIVVLGAGSLILAFALKGVINALLFAYTIYTCGLVLPVIAGFYKNRLQVTTLGALAAIIGGGGTALISKLPTVMDVSRVPVISSLAGIQHLDLWALAVSGLLLFTVSYIEKGIKNR